MAYIMRVIPTSLLAWLRVTGWEAKAAVFLPPPTHTHTHSLSFIFQTISIVLFVWRDFFSFEAFAICDFYNRRTMFLVSKKWIFLTCFFA